MAGKDRDIEEIKAFCQKYRIFCDEVTNEATRLKQMAYAAEGSLRDQVGQRAIQRVVEFGDELIKIVDQGMEPILELEKRNIQMEDDMDRIAGMIR